MVVIFVIFCIFRCFWALVPEWSERKSAVQALVGMDGGSNDRGGGWGETGSARLGDFCFRFRCIVFVFYFIYLFIFYPPADGEK